MMHGQELVVAGLAEAVEDEAMGMLSLLLLPERPTGIPTGSTSSKLLAVRVDDERVSRLVGCSREAQRKRTKEVMHWKKEEGMFILFCSDLRRLLYPIVDTQYYFRDRYECFTTPHPLLLTATAVRWLFA
jgi:hypothetical protein